MSKLPETLVLLATVHGGLDVENGKVKTFVVPEGITITRIMSARPGVCNVTMEKQIDALVGTLSTNPEETGKTIKTTQVEVLKDIDQRLKGDAANNGMLQQFVRSRIGNPTKQVFRSGDTMLDKFLVRDAGESMYKAFDYKLNIINMPGIPDLFDLMYYETSGPAVKTRSKYYGVNVYLSMLVDRVKSQGVSNLIFYDMTCSSFMSDAPMTERQERELRRDIIQRGVGKKTKSHKTRRSKSYSKWKRSSRFSRSTLRYRSN